MSPTFSGNETTYTATTTNATNSILATATDSDSVIEIKNGVTTITNAGTITWGAGANVVEITVTNKTETTVYTVTVTKN